MVGRRVARALPGGVLGRTAPALHAERVVPRRAVVAWVGLGGGGGDRKVCVVGRRWLRWGCPWRVCVHGGARLDMTVVGWTRCPLIW